MRKLTQAEIARALCISRPKYSERMNRNNDYVQIEGEHKIRSFEKFISLLGFPLVAFLLESSDGWWDHYVGAHVVVAGNESSRTRFHEALARYNAQLSSLPLDPLIRGYASYELQLLNDLRKIVATAIIDSGYTPSPGEQNAYFDNQRWMKLTWEYLPASRHVNVLLRSPFVQGSNQHITKPLLCEIGVIRSISVSVPSHHFKASAIHLHDELLATVVAAYRALEERLVQAVQDVASVFDPLYVPIRTALKLRRRQDIMDEVRLYLTDSTSGLYVLDRHGIRETVERFKEEAYQVPDMSPFERITRFSTTHFPYEKTITREIRSTFVGIDSAEVGKDGVTRTGWPGVPYYRHTGTDTLAAEMSHFTDEGISSFFIAERREIILALGCSIGHDAVIKEVLAERSKELIAAFENGIKNWSPYLIYSRDLS